jgi:hypothetical protein
MSEPIKRVCIAGTAPSIKLIPWDDPTLEVWQLNDMHLIPTPRADRWFDLHPFEHFYFRPPGQKINALDVPVGTYVRPTGHIEWLAKQSIPVYLQKPDPRVPRGIVFPRAEVEARFGQWFDSTPAWMLGLALLEGYQEIHIYGIHLATEWEYQKQKPNMTYLCGLAAGMGVKVITPVESPLLRATHQYAYERDPALPVTAAQRELQRRQQMLAQLETAAKGIPWWRRGAKAQAQARVWRGKAETLDAQLAIDYAVARKRATSPV